MVSIPYHIPVLLEPSINALDIKPDGIYIDATFGGGGHSAAIISMLGENGKLFGFDQDLDSFRNNIDDDRFIFVRSNFRYIINFMRFFNIDSIDGIIADLGVSSHHFDEASRGFSFRDNGPLDMRMNQKGTYTAASFLNNASEEQIRQTLSLYGEVDKAHLIAKKIVEVRKNKDLAETKDLQEILLPLINPKHEKKELAKIFQALRIEINDEMGALKELITSSTKILKPSGRLVIISYHSLEDRLVKNFFKTGNFEGVRTQDSFGNSYSPFKALTSKPIAPDETEISMNPRARSAKMRVGIKI